MNKIYFGHEASEGESNIKHITEADDVNAEIMKVLSFLNHGGHYKVRRQKLAVSKNSRRRERERETRRHNRRLSTGWVRGAQVVELCFYLAQILLDSHFSHNQPSKAKKRHSFLGRMWQTPKLQRLDFIDLTSFQMASHEHSLISVGAHMICCQ